MAFFSQDTNPVLFPPPFMFPRRRYVRKRNTRIYKTSNKSWLPMGSAQWVLYGGRSRSCVEPRTEIVAAVRVVARAGARFIARAFGTNLS